MADKAQKIKEQANTDISELRMAQEQGIITEFGMGKLEALEEMVDFIDSLQEEPVSEDLEEAAKRYATEGDEISGLHIIDEEVEAFKAGANWQKQQFEKDYTNLCNGIATAKGLAVTMAYDKGMADAREQMMKDAYDAYVSYIRDNSEAVVYLKNTSITMPSHFPKKDLEEGDKLKIVIIKED